MNQTVIGVFDTSTQAKSAKEALIAADFDSGNIDFSQFGEQGHRGADYQEEHRNSVTGFFANLFDTDDTTAHQYSDVASRGTVVTVHTSTMDHAKRAAAILDQHGAIDFDDRATAYETSYKKNAKYDAAANNRNYDLDHDTIKVIKENVNVGKREVQGGSVSVRSRIVEKPVTEDLRLRYEEVYVRRNPVDRVATEADFAAAGGTITARETAEEAVVAKEARVVEEIEVGKDVKTRTQTINETVRETEVDVTTDGLDKKRTLDANAKPGYDKSKKA